MAKNTSITLGEHFEAIINKSIASGRYASASEVVRAGLRLLDKEEQKIALLRNAIEDGEKSGYLNDFDPKQHLEDLNESFSK